MKIPLQISSRKMTLSSGTIDIIKQKVQKLELFCDKIIACRIMVETPHRHKNHGSLYNISIDISVPGAELAVNKEANEDMFVAIRDAFEAARRQIIQYFKKLNSKNARQAKSPEHLIDSGESNDEFQASENFLDDYSLNEPLLGRTATSFN